MEHIYVHFSNIPLLHCDYKKDNKLIILISIKI